MIGTGLIATPTANVRTALIPSAMTVEARSAARIARRWPTAPRVHPDGVMRRVLQAASCVPRSLGTVRAGTQRRNEWRRLRAGSPRPGVSVGPTSEFSLFFRVKPGEGESLRAALRDLQDTPGYRPGDYGMAISTIHEARFVLFDDDTRLAFITSFDGPWDAYMEDFFTSGPTLALFDVDLPAHGGLRRPSRPGRREGVRPRRAADRGRLRAQLRRHGEGDPQGPARQRGLPAGARPPGRRGGAAAPGACSRCSTRPPTDLDSTPCPITSPGRARWPTRSPTSPTSTRSRARSGRAISCS